MTTQTRIRVGQVNLRGSQVATGELPIVARELNLDIILFQEQYLRARDLSIILFGDQPKAGIYVASPGSSVVTLEHLSTCHYIAINITRGAVVDLVLTSAYF